MAAPLPTSVQVATVAPLQMSDWLFVLRNADTLLVATWQTILLTVASVLLGFAAGFPAGAIEVYGGPYVRKPIRWIGIVLRGTPILVIFFILFFGIGVGSSFQAALIGLGFRSAAYQGQIFRGALQSVSEGQMEAARAIGLSRLGAIRRVIVPQALRRSIPGFQNEFTIVLKDTSIAFAIGFAELIKVSRDLFVQETTAVLEVFLFASAIYFVLTFGTNRTLDYVGRVYAIPTGEST